MCSILWTNSTTLIVKQKKRKKDMAKEESGFNWGSAIPAAAGAIYGLFRNKGAEDQRQVDQQKKLNDLGVSAGKEMGAYNQSLQMDMWNKTNYEAQKKHMEAAGLNPALMYGQGGGGGTTAGSASGSVSAAQAANSAATETAGNATTGMGLQLASQLALQKAQKENIEADTANKKAGTEQTGVQTEGAKIDVYTKEQTKNETIDRIIAEAGKAQSEAAIQFRNNEMDERTVQDRIKQIQLETVNKILSNEGTSIENRKNEAETAIKQFEAENAKQGIAVGAPWYVKMVADILGKIGLNPLK